MTRSRPSPLARCVRASLLAVAVVMIAPTASAQRQPNLDDLDTLIRFGVKSAPEAQPGTIRLATYNIENLFDDQDDPSLKDRYEDRTMTTDEARLEALAKAIHAVDADILCVQEIESRQALEWFAERYLKDMGYEHIVSIDAGDQRGIEQAVLSRFPITHFENWPAKPLGGTHPEKYGTQKNWYAGEPIVFHRSPLRIDVEVPTSDGSTTLTLFVVHQKSGRYSGYWRLAEAKGLAAIIAPLLADDPDRLVAVLGDFNTLADSEPIAEFMGIGLVDLFAGSGGPPSRTTTHESNRRIDLILASPGLAGAVVTGSAFVLGTIARPVGMDRRQPPPPGYAADHYPVAVDLRLDSADSGIMVGQ